MKDCPTEINSVRPGYVRFTPKSGHWTRDFRTRRRLTEIRRSETTDSLEPVADRVGGWRARRVVAGPALNQIGLVGVAEEDEGGTIVGGLAVTGNLPSFLQHSADRRRVFGRGRGVNRQCE